MIRVMCINRAPKGRTKVYKSEQSKTGDVHEIEVWYTSCLVPPSPGKAGTSSALMDIAVREFVDRLAKLMSR